MPWCEESIWSEMHPRFVGTLRQHTGIPDRWPCEDLSRAASQGTLGDSVARSAEIGLKPWLTGASCQYPTFITYLQAEPSVR